MTSRPLYLRREAKDELRAAFQWYESRSRGLGHEFLRAVRVVLAAIQRDPGHFPFALDTVRMAALTRFPYLVYFFETSRGTSVLAVIHGRRHPRRWQRRR